ncbi:hypothetical protein Pan97_51760 [Bremerella volcania]|uniref:Transmembrane protein n=1 Tax=Bremerella volcania TaxID=2527984 RepID=A0A518CFU5_9BACT|nr:hypothetical protein [Bremerella volcania]QDU78096.1 hypothetical protein Pan97_51760 [Bremerella volcania]
MTDDSPFKSPEIVDQPHDSFDKRSQEIFKLARGLRWLEVLCACYLGGLYASAFAYIAVAESLGKDPSSLSVLTTLTTLFIVYSIVSVISGIVVYLVLARCGYLIRYYWIVAIAGIPLVSIVGVVLAARLIHRELRSHGLKFGWIGPSHKAIVEQLRHDDGSPVDPKTSV